MSFIANIKDTKLYSDEVFGHLKYLTDSDKELMRDNSVCLHFRSGETVYREGEKPTGLVCLVEGKVKVFKEGFAGRDWIARMVKPVEMVGYRALFAEENYNASAQTIENSVIFIIDRDILLEILRRNPDLTLNFMKILAKELGFVNCRTITLTQKHIRGRLAETLLFLRDNYGYEDNEKMLKIYLSREEIANLSNMTASNAIRTLSAFNAEELIELKGRKIILKDEVQLEKISRLG